ncbi:MAG: putative MFS transporter [Promethearchaeota archaeon]|nr:MAG: putative MFS transporter [Candidatus Lokiarchaeota archaeon]
MSEESKIKFNVKLVIFIGFAFFTAEIAWALYNARVPLLLKDYLPEYESGALVLQLGIIGILMALDNMLGVVLQPITGTLSDKTRSKYGRRMPFLMIGVPIAAVFFALIPWETSILTLLIWMFFFGLAMGFYRAPAVSLMPDFVKPVNRSKGNAIINIFGGIGAAIGYVMSLLASIITLQGSFLVVSILMVIALGVLLWKVKESESFSYQKILEFEAKKDEKFEEEKEPGLIASLKYILKEKDKSTLAILFAIFFWFVAYQGLVALLSIFGTDVLGVSDDLAGFLPFFVAGALIITAYPLSKLANKIGRRLCIKIGLCILIMSLFIGTFLALVKSLIGIMIVLAIAGAGWALVNVNSIVIVWELAPSKERIGTYTGVYYFFSFMAAIFGPFIMGSLTDLMTPGFPISLLINAIIFFGISLILMFFVKRGEAELTEEMKLEAEKAM